MQTSYGFHSAEGDRYPHRRSPECQPVSPPQVSMRRVIPGQVEIRPDSTMSDFDPKRMPPPLLAAHYYPVPPPQHAALPRAPRMPRDQPDFCGSPKRLSLDERLERELGIKMEQEQEQQQQQQQLLQQKKEPSGAAYAPHHHTSSLPATVPTYDNPPVEQLQPRTVAVEKEQAMAAAQMVTTKLLEMQAAKESERRWKREQRLAERQRQLLQSQEGASAAAAAAVGEQKVAAARILEQVEQQELATEEQKVKKAKKNQDSPTLITLKPFYRPHEKKGKKRPEPIFVQDEVDDAVDIPRSPVPLPDNSTCTPVLVKLGFGVTKSSSKKTVQYKDGVRPGQGSPDRSSVNNSRVPSPVPVKAPGKKYKQVMLTVITQHVGDTESEEEGPPPPPPGSPPRYHTRELIAMYGKPKIVEAQA